MEKWMTWTWKKYLLMMTPCNVEKLFAVLTNQIDKGCTYMLSLGKEVSGNILISKAARLLANTSMFNQDIR